MDNGLEREVTPGSGYKERSVRESSATVITLECGDVMEDVDQFAGCFKEGTPGKEASNKSKESTDSHGFKWLK